MFRKLTCTITYMIIDVSVNYLHIYIYIHTYRVELIDSNYSNYAKRRLRELSIDNTSQLFG